MPNRLERGGELERKIRYVIVMVMVMVINEPKKID